MTDNVFQEYRRKLIKESVLKALVCGASVGFAALFVTAIITWLVGLQSVGLCLAICIGVFVLGMGIATPIFYNKNFKPNIKTIAMRIDELGLEERVLTMTELEGQDNFIANRQREDTIRALGTVNAALLKIVVTAPMLIIMAVSATVGIGMTSVSVLAAGGVFKSGSQLIEGEDEPDVYRVMYLIKGKGSIDGVTEQHITEGEDASVVLAIPEEGWVFYEWSDGKTNPERQDKAIDENIRITAIFTQLSDGIEENDPSDDTEDKPANGQEGDDPNDNTGEGDGGKYDPANQVIDGKTFYGDTTFDEAYGTVIETLGQSSMVDGEMSSIITDYFESIEK